MLEKYNEIDISSEDINRIFKIKPYSVYVSDYLNYKTVSLYFTFGSIYQTDLLCISFHCRKDVDRIRLTLYENSTVGLVSQKEGWIFVEHNQLILNHITNLLNENREQDVNIFIDAEAQKAVARAKNWIINSPINNLYLLKGFLDLLEEK